MKKNLIMRTIIVTLFCLMITGCSNSSKKINATVEGELFQESKEAIKSFQLDKSINLNIKKEKDRFIVYPDGRENDAFTMLIPSNFYEKAKFEQPRILNEKKMPKEQQKMLSDAKKVALKYVDNSQIIKKNDKNACKEAIKNVEMVYANFLEKDYEDIAMVTVDKVICVNANLEDYFSCYTYLHELIHVISNVTNKGTKYEFSYYRASKLNEAITDLIAVKLAEENGMSGYEVSAYQTYYECVMYIIKEFDMLNTYYYSDGYSKIEKNSLDLYVLLMENIGDGKCENIIPYLINEVLK